MFESVELAPPDPILGLTEAFNQDTNPDKVNLGVGVYKDPTGATPVLPSVKQAEQMIWETEKSKGYKPITGDPAYGKVVQAMVFGAGSEIVTSFRAATTHTPGGTGALRVAGDYLNSMHPGAKIWMSEPTWANHPAVFKAAGLEVATYPYFDAATNALDFDAMMAGLEKVSAGDVVLLHACCHNPTGVDPTPEQFTEIGKLLASKKALPLVDFAYQGFGIGIEEDAAGLRALAAEVGEFILCSSFSKNFGLYNERTGAMTVVSGSKEATAAVLSQVKVCVRRNYSNPPAHGAAIVTTIMNDDALRSQWEQELAEMRDRINGMRKLFADTLTSKGVSLLPAGNGFVTAQKGMFSMSGLSKDEVAALREQFAIYIVGSGRINVAGMTEQNMEYLCNGIAKVKGV